MGAFTKIFQRLKLTADTNVSTQTTTVIAADTTNSSLVIAPNGTGALVADIPDGLVSGGNARGANAVDLQMNRIVNTQVALGIYSVIAGGEQNTAAANLSTVVGGRGNTAGDTFAFVGGGASNAANTSYSVVSGGQSNTASSAAHTTVVGGFSNTASGYGSIAGGVQSVASGYNSVVLGGGTASGTRSVLFGQSGTSRGDGCVSIGSGTNAIGDRSVAIGDGANANASSSTALGTGSNAYLQGQLAIGYNFYLNTPTGVQYSILMSKKQDTLSSAATTVLSLDGTGTTSLIIPVGGNTLWGVKVVATAVVQVAGGTLVLGDSYMGEYTLLFKRVGGASSVVGVNAGNIIYDTNMISAAFTFSAGASQELKITFKAPTTASATTFRCIAKVELTEVTY